MFRLGLGCALAAALGAVAVLLSWSALQSQPRLDPSTPPADAGEPDLGAIRPDPTPHHLPAWVQTGQAVPLWSGPDKQAVQFTSLPVWTFLKVTGAQADRLQVLYAGDGSARQAGPGWVSATDVQPSDAGGAWLRNHRASHLFADPQSAASGMDVPQWSWMVRLEDAAATDRLHVRVYAPNLSAVAGEGWLPAADVGPTNAPTQSVWTGAQPDASAAQTEFASHQQFIDAVAAAARASGSSSFAPVSVTVAQAILESNWGQSLLSREGNNYFGMKAMGEFGNDGAVWMRTLEYSAGSPYNILAPFRAYKSLADSIVDHARLFRDASRYRQALQVVNDPDEFARRIALAGYATDPAYASKLIDIMHRYDLYRFDATPSAPAPAGPDLAPATDAKTT